MTATNKTVEPAPMYRWALALCLPVILISIVVPLWFGWQYAHRMTRAAGVIALGLDQFGLYILVVVVIAVGAKLGAPLAVDCTVGHHPVAARIFLLPWIIGLAGSCVVTIAESVPLLPPMLGDGLPRYLVRGSWVALDLTVSLLPVTLMWPSAWCWHGPLVVAPAPVTIERPPASAITLHPTTLLAFLERVLQATPQVVADPRLVTVARTGEIITTQGALAKLLHTTKGTVHRRLHELAAQRRIILQTSARRTYIRVIAQHVAASSERSRTSEKTDGPN